jgi:DNA polymerase elongation subunit (family B)
MFDFRTLDIPNEDGQKSFRIQMFGINEIGETCALFVDDFRPFFYVKLPPSWRAQDMDQWFNETKKSCGKYYAKDCLSVSMEKHSKLYEFTADTSYIFAKCVFRNSRAFNQFKRKVTNNKNMPTYESKIPPLLRYFHIHNISPSGWIQICIQDMEIPAETLTSCTYEYMCSVGDIKPLKDKETPVPYKIASVDIEASSSHGDFPLPVKDYKRMATQVIDVLEKKMIRQTQKMTVDAVNSWLKKSILSVFSIGSAIDGIDVVFPKETPNKENLKIWTKLVLEQTMAINTANKDSHVLKISEMFESIATASASEETDTTTTTTAAVREFVTTDSNAKLYNTNRTKTAALTAQQKTLTLAEFIIHPEHTREMKISSLNLAMTDLFPPLDGDRVTFIGTTFLKFGQKEPYKNHCLVVGTCDEVEGLEICTVNSERECLVDWTQLIQDENPDIIIGYNIFGFDYQFMFQRAKELDCVEEFCALSRVQSEMCYKEDYETKEKELEHTQNRLASGDYDLHYPPMSGRLQIDLLLYFRRDYNMSSYKLDDVAGTMIRDDVKAIRVINDESDKTKTKTKTELYSKNLAGLHVSDFIHLEIASFTTDYYAAGKKFRVLEIRKDVQEDGQNGIPEGTYNVIVIDGDHSVLDPTKQSLKWGMAKDDVSPQDIFRLTKESAKSRAIVAKYCVQDCNLVHHLMTKVDVLTGYIEMARICNVPISFLVFRGQGIKLTSYVAKVCREKDTLMPDLEIPENTENDGYEGAIVLPPKCAMYGENPVACVDYSSLYPSIAKGWNLSPNSKVWSKNYDLNDNLVKINDEVVTELNRETLEKAAAKYANLPNYEYIEVTFDSFEQKCVREGGAKIKTKSGKKVVRWAQFPNGQEGIIPCIIGDLLKARKETRKKAEKEPDPFIANILDKRQLGYKVTANSLYGQMGSCVSTFFEKDVAASITAIGRMMIIYAKHMVEEIYGNSLYTSTKTQKTVRTRSAYVYGDTDSVFFTFNLEDPETGAPIRGKEALEWTIEISQEAAALCSMFLPPPMLLAYEKTLMNFILLSKKRYVGILYEYNPNKGKLKFMGLPLKRRDSCDYLKDVYGGILTILMKEPDNVQKAIELLNTYLKDLVKGQVAMDKLALTKSLRSDYKNPKTIAHKVLADRIGEREPGNRPKPGERIKYAFIENKNEKLLGNRIETPEYIKEHKLAIDYHYYITNQLMNPLLQLFSLALDKVYQYKNKKHTLQSHLDKMFEDCDQDLEVYMKKREKYCSAEVKQLLFDPFLTEIYNTQNGIQTLFQFYKRT